MKKTILSLLAAGTLALAGCATPPSPKQTEVAFLAGCSSYGVALTGAVQLRQMGKLNQVQISNLNTVMQQITPLCTQKTIPSNPVLATQQISQALTTSVLQAGAAYIQSQQQVKP